MLSSGISEPAKPGKRNGLRDLLEQHQVRDARSRYRRRRPLLGADQCRPAARRDARSRHRARCAKARPLALAPVLAKKPPARGAGRASAPRCRSRSPRARARSISVLMAYADRLERFTHWYVQLWAESLGKDGKGTTPIGGARPGRSAQPVAALHRRPARQAVHHRHRRRARAWAAHGRGARQACGRAGLCRQDHRRSGRGGRPRHRRDAGQERLPGAHHPHSTSSTRQASAN